MVIDLLKQSEALLEGHFLLSSGRHSDRYVQCAKLLQYPDRASEVIAEIIQKLKKDNVEIDLVVGPAMGGIIVAYEMGRQLGIPAIFTEREDGKVLLRRGFEIKPGKKVVIAEDVVTTGLSSMEAAETIRSHGGEVVAIASLVDRSAGAKLELPLYSAVKLDITTYDAKECPLCKTHGEAIKPGSRKMAK